MYIYTYIYIHYTFIDVYICKSVCGIAAEARGRRRLPARRGPPRAAPGTRPRPSGVRKSEAVTKGQRILELPRLDGYPEGQKMVS